ncbi:MAG: hypothetical protein N3A38_02435 [Planctomycetota bacterium]|nr:hypothetical protein [Planctomycetota bacterium]
MRIAPGGGGPYPPPDVPAPARPSGCASAASVPEREAKAEIQRLLSESGWNGPAREVEVEYYPYATLRHTVRVRNGRVIVRLHDSLRKAPAPVVFAMLAILAARLCRRRDPARAMRIYKKYLTSLPDDVLDSYGKTDRRREVEDQPVGRWQDLRKVKERVDAAFFGGAMSAVRISFSPASARRRLGSYDRARNRVLISRAFDRPDAPDYVLDYMVYHELLHAIYPVRREADGRRSFHSREFREAERRFPRYREAVAWIRRMR